MCGEYFMRMTYEKKIEEAKKQRIYLPDNLLERNIVGVYGFFATKGNKEQCFYIGKATNMLARLLSSKGHVHYYLYEYFGKLVPEKIKHFLNLGYDIEVKILEEIDYEDTSFSRAAHRLALAEIQQIVKYQEQEPCLEQLPEGVGPKEKEFWEENYRKSAISN